MGSVTGFFCPNLAYVADTEDLLNSNSSLNTVLATSDISWIAGTPSNLIFESESASLSMESGENKDSLIVSQLTDGGKVQVYRIKSTDVGI